MAFINSYKPPPPPKVDNEPEPGPFDVNFNAKVPDCLETDRVRLVPFVPSIHAKPFYDECQKDRERIEAFMPVTWPTYSVFLTWMYAHHFRIPRLSRLLSEESIAEMIGYMHLSASNLSVELAPVIVLPRAQRTFVSSNAIGLVIKYALDAPQDGGLGYRRVSWQANPRNEGSIKAAERMGMKVQAISRWTWVLPPGREGGLPLVDGRRGDGQGRNSTVLSICWDDWEYSGGREQVEKAMARVLYPSSMRG